MCITLVNGPVCSLLLLAGVVFGAAENDVVELPLLVRLSDRNLLSVPPLLLPPLLLPPPPPFRVPPQLMVEVLRPKVDTKVFVSGL